MAEGFGSRRPCSRLFPLVMYGACSRLPSCAPSLFAHFPVAYSSRALSPSVLAFSFPVGLPFLRSCPSLPVRHNASGLAVHFRRVSELVFPSFLWFVGGGVPPSVAHIVPQGACPRQCLFQEKMRFFTKFLIFRIFLYFHFSIVRVIYRTFKAVYNVFRSCL